jgi:glycerol-3-phosphate O-acyltransferase
MIQMSLQRLSGLVEMKREVLEPLIQAKKNYNNIIMLSYYRNNLIHVFINEAEISCTLIGIGSLF